MVKETLNKLVLLVGLFLLFGIIVFRNTIGAMVGTLLNPMLTLLPLHVVIMVLAAITGLYASLIQKYTMNWDLMRRNQEKSKNLQKEMRQAQLSNNAAKMKKLQAQQAEMLGDQVEIMKQQFKPMLYISIISIPIFYWVYFVIRQYPDSSMVFPFWGPHKLTDNLFGLVPYWLVWYFLCSYVVSQMTRKTLNIGGM